MHLPRVVPTLRGSSEGLMDFYKGGDSVRHTSPTDLASRLEAGFSYFIHLLPCARSLWEIEQ